MAKMNWAKAATSANALRYGSFRASETYSPIVKKTAPKKKRARKSDVTSSDLKKSQAEFEIAVSAPTARAKKGKKKADRALKAERRSAHEAASMAKMERKRKAAALEAERREDPAYRAKMIERIKAQQRKNWSVVVVKKVGRRLIEKETGLSIQVGLQSLSSRDGSD